jgi:3-deoxy-D-manno-octulosonate 8-phosphate phosphatase (KDO 8-P phosphatase)
MIDYQGKELKVFHVQDGFSIVFFKRLGFKTAIISARYSEAVEFRAKDLGIDRVYMDVRPKTVAYKKLLEELNLQDEEACFLADDLPDLCVLKRVGFAVAVKNASEEVKEIAHYVTKQEGGKGAVREVIELILKTQGKWTKLLQEVGFS